MLSPLITQIPPLQGKLDGPGFCGSCHLMDPWVETWSHSAYREVASCSDCHILHDVIRGAYYKAFVGVRDTVDMVLGTWPAPIKLSSHGGVVTQENCYRCHSTVISNQTAESPAP